MVERRMAILAGLPEVSQSYKATTARPLLLDWLAVPGTGEGHTLGGEALCAAFC